MIIPAYVLITIIIVGLLIPGYRPTVINFFTAFGNLILGTFSRLWSFISGNAPTVGAGAVSIFRRIIALTLFLVLIAIIIVILGYVLLGGAMMVLGAISGNFGLTMLMLLLLIIYGFIGIFPSNFLFKAVRAIISLVVTGILIYISGTIVWTAFGKISPEVQKSASRASKNTAGELANRLDKYSLQSEKESGIFARVKNDCRVYNSKNQSFTSLKKDDLVYVLNTEGKQKNTDGEGMTQIMLPNQDGDFIGGQKGWIVSRVINWDTNSFNQINLIETVNIGENAKIPRSLTVGLQEGNYEVEIIPSKNSNETIQAFVDAKGEDGIYEKINVEKNSITIPKGKVGYAVWASCASIIKFYKI